MPHWIVLALYAIAGGVLGVAIAKAILHARMRRMEQSILRLYHLPQSEWVVIPVRALRQLLGGNPDGK